MDADGTDLHPHPERVSEAYAEERIHAKIDLYDEERPREGLRNVDEAMKAQGVPPAVRLHYITAIAHLGTRAREDRTKRGALAGRDLDAGAPPQAAAKAPLRNHKA